MFAYKIYNSAINYGKLSTYVLCNKSTRNTISISEYPAHMHNVIIIIYYV